MKIATRRAVRRTINRTRFAAAVMSWVGLVIALAVTVAMQLANMEGQWPR